MKNFLLKINIRNNQKGFTLVELMVSLSLFVIVVLALVSSLYTVNGASRKVTAMKNVLDNLNFAVESMGRTIRTGSSIVCGGVLNGSGTNNCPISTPGQIPGERLIVSSTLGVDEVIEYQWVVNPINGVTGQVEKRIRDGFGIWSNWISLTAPEIDVQRLAFYVDGADVSDSKQPSVIIFMQGIAKVKGLETTTPFSIQTYVSQRATE